MPTEGTSPASRTTRKSFSRRADWRRTGHRGAALLSLNFCAGSTARQPAQQARRRRPRHHHGCAGPCGGLRRKIPERAHLSGTEAGPGDERREGGDQSRYRPGSQAARRGGQRRQRGCGHFLREGVLRRSLALPASQTVRRWKDFNQRVHRIAPDADQLGRPR